jgi:hypothetical protein
MIFYYKAIRLPQDEPDRCLSIRRNTRKEFRYQLHVWNTSNWYNDGGRWQYVEVPRSCVKRLFPQMLDKISGCVWPRELVSK